MFKVKWDVLNNGIILSDNISENDEIVPPRPVFLQELELLGINKKYSLPKTDKPICWCVDSRYFYKGELFFERKGSNIYTEPEIVFNNGFTYRILQEIDLKKVVYLNLDKIKILEDEAMDFIFNSFKNYKSRVEAMVVAFSGGKDSQVILDLVSRTIPAENYICVFQDTDMELPTTYNLVEYTKQEYSYKYPNFNFVIAKNDTSAVELWDKYGPPSRTSRWCCSVMKTAVFRKKMKEVFNTDKQVDALVFEGVRAEESARRRGYDRIGDSVKHTNLINCRPIFNWNMSEIFLYMFSRNIVINPAYRLGLTRVGCGVCPFASDWSEYVIKRVFPQCSEKYIDIIEKMARNLGIKEQSKINEYVCSGNWKKNQGGRGLIQDGSRMDVISKQPNYEVVISNPKTDWKIWLSTIGECIIENKDNEYIGELKYKSDIIKFTVVEEENKLKFIAKDTSLVLSLTGLLTKVLTKTTSCELCGVCEAECPTGALTISEKVNIDRTVCVHCTKCLDVGTKGCIIAQRKQVYEGGVRKTKTSGLDKYSTFGLRSEWVSSYFDLGNVWFGSYPKMGTKMIPAAINWLREAELIDSKEKTNSELYTILKSAYYKNPNIIWELIWVNLSFNSSIINSYVSKVKFDVGYSREDLLAIIRDDYPSLNETTIRNPIKAMINMYRNSPFGCKNDDILDSNSICVARLNMSGNAVKETKRIKTNYVSIISIAYLLYKMAETNNQYEMVVSELIYPESINPFTVFGCDTEKLLPVLRTLTNMGVLSADLLGGLENVHLNKESTSVDVLKNLLERI